MCECLHRRGGRVGLWVMTRAPSYQFGRDPINPGIGSERDPLSRQRQCYQTSSDLRSADWHWYFPRVNATDTATKQWEFCAQCTVQDDIPSFISPNFPTKHFLVAADTLFYLLRFINTVWIIPYSSDKIMIFFSIINNSMAALIKSEHIIQVY